MQFSHVLLGQELQRLRCIPTIMPQFDLIRRQLGPLLREPRNEMLCRDKCKILLYILFSRLLLHCLMSGRSKWEQGLFAIKIRR